MRSSAALHNPGRATRRAVGEEVEEGGVMALKRLPLRLIRLDFQPRESLIQQTVTEYRERMKRREKIKPVLVCHDGSNFWLKDGFHRFEAAKESGRKTIMAEVIPGTLAEMEAEFRRYLVALTAKLQKGWS
jgi:ParB/Sulfiredoxin domain